MRQVRDLIGQVLDERYRVVERLGEGAMGSVYRGERLKLGRMVAIKVLNDEFPNDSSRKRFEREAEAMAKLEHPNCATVLDVGAHAERPYVVMELVSGQNVRSLLDAGLLPIPRAVEIVRQVLSGLSHAHEHGIIHRDIKPANIIVAQKAGVGDLVKILDFGLARFRNHNSTLTGAMVIGTPHYMAPEQVVGGDLDHRVDIYACGVLLFEMLTGTKPFDAAEPIAVCMQQANVDPPRLAERAPNRVFGALEDVVARALAKDRNERFGSAEEFARALVDATKRLDDTAPSPPQLDATLPLPPTPVPSKDEAPQPLPVAKPAASRRRVAFIVSGLLASLAVVGVAITIAGRSEAKPTSAVTAAPVIVDEPKPVVPEPTAGDPVDALIARARELSTQGRREAAIDFLLDARKTYPQDARLPYEASKLYLDKMWWIDGLKQARAAIALDPAYKTDPELIKIVLKNFNATAGYNGALARFLRDDVGAAAKPFLQETADGHPNPIVRKRAKAELRRYP